MICLPKYTSVLVLKLLCLVALVICQKIGDVCTSKKGETGTCKNIVDCDGSIDDIHRGIHPRICFFKGTVPIVCCVEKLTTLPSRSFETTFDVGKSISKEKCIEYGQSVFEQQRAPTLNLGNNIINVSLCGHKGVPLIVGGKQATPKEFPHMALIGFEEEGKRVWKCGGTLISERFVMTAAHCSQIRYSPARWVLLGDLNIAHSNDDAQPQIISIIERIPHPNYEPKYNDIALLKLNQNVKFNAYIRPACLPGNNVLTERHAIVTGWGHTVYSGGASDHLLKAVLDIFHHDRCNDYYNSKRTTKLNHGIIDDTQICAGGLSASKDTCQGDSGGPLQIYSHDVYCMYTVVGITSFGAGCGIVGVPAVYTRVSAFVPWIENIVWKN